MVKVIPFAAPHQAGVLALILPIQQKEFAIPITVADQPDLQCIENFYQQGCGNFWVALEGDAVIGSIALLDIGCSQAALRKMFVRADRRGPALGVAAQLLAALLCWAADQNVREIYLGTTAQFLAAHRFYEKHGFTAVSRATLPPAFPVMAVDSVFYRYSLV